MRPAPRSIRALRAAALALSVLVLSATACAPRAATPVTTAPRPAPAPPGDGDIPDLAAEVNPFIGTAPGDAKNPAWNGHGGSVFPGPAAPFGMVQWSPDTENAEPSGYGYADHTITGFSLTHLSGAGCKNGDLPIMPTLDPRSPAGGFDHGTERAAPGYYAVTLASGIRAELTATKRTGVGRFAFPAGARTQSFVIDAGRSSASFAASPRVDAVVAQDGPATLSGYTTGGLFCAGGLHPNGHHVYRLYFAIEADRPFAHVDSKDGRAVATLDGATGATVQLKVGVSYVSAENARANLEAESPGWDFDGTRDRLRREWSRRLSAIRVEGGSVSDRTKLYTALYHALLFPSVFSDASGEYVGFDRQRRTVPAGHALYANFSGWDMYRSQIQLLAVLFPAEASDMLQSLVLDAAQCGALPKWGEYDGETAVMVGDPGAIVVASGYAFGATGFDARAALATMMRTTDGASTGCNGFKAMPARFPYVAYGYVAADQPFWGEEGAASTTLEYTSRDFAVAQLARALGDATSHRRLMARAAYWRNLLHENGSLQARLHDGRFIEPLEGPGQGNEKEYVEGNAEQYLWMVPYDPRTLFDALGGDARVVARLDTFFSRLNAGLEDPYFYVGNEPNFATPWLYDWAGAPARTQDVVRRIVDEAFRAAPGGLPGNDDLGALSSWFLWGALGLYPSIPGVGGFAIGSPLFPRAVVRVGGAHDLVIVGKGAPARYVQGVAIDGKALASPWVSYEQIRGGAEIAFELGGASSRWGSASTDAPPSFGPGTFEGRDAAMNQRGVTADSDPTAGAFDALGNTYSRDALVAATAPGGNVSVGGATLAWPGPGGSAVSGPLDNVVAVGQTIRLPERSRGSKLVLLGAAVGCAARTEGEATLTYADRTTAPFKLAFGHWAKASDTPVAVRMPYRNGPAGRVEGDTFVYSAEVPIDPGRDVAELRLPSRVSCGRMHVFAWGLAR